MRLFKVLCLLILGNYIVFAQNHFSFENDSVQQNATFEFDIKASSDVQIGAFQFDIRFDEAYVNLGTEPVTSLESSFNISYNQIDDNTLRVIGYTTENLTFDNLPIIRMQYKSLSNPIDLSPSISNFIVSDLSGTEIQMEFKVGIISILGSKFIINDENIDFGKVKVGSNHSRSFRIYNNGNQALEISAMTVPYGITNSDDFPIRIDSGNSKELIIIIDTSEEIVIDGQISFVTTDTNEDRNKQVVQIKGEVFSENILFLSDQNGVSNEVSTIDVFLKNQKECIGVQFDLILPESFVLDTNRVTLSSRLSEHSFSISSIDQNKYRFLIYSTSNETIKGNDGSLLSFEVIPNNAFGSYRIELTEALAIGLEKNDILSSFRGSDFYVDAPNLEINANQINLGEFNSDIEQSFSFVFYNNSSLNLKIDSLQYNENKISFDNLITPFSIERNTNKSINGRYKSNSIGAFEESIVIHHNGIGLRDQINLSGNVVAQNYMYAENVELLNDVVDTLRVKLRNDMPVRGIQFDLNINQNINVDYDKLTTFLDDFTLSTSTLNNGKQRFLIYSTQKQIIPAGDHNIFFVPINGVDVTNEGAYNVVFLESLITDSNNIYIQTEAPITAQIKIVKETSPVTTAQNITTSEDSPVTFELIATDKDGDELTFTTPASTAQGGELNSSGNEVIYNPKSDFYGSDEFTYQVSDGKNTITEKVNLEVSAVNDAPTLSNLNLNTKEDKKVTIVLTSLDVDNTADEISFEIIDEAAFGYSQIVQDTLSYTPISGFYGYDEMSIISFDGTDFSDIALISIDVTEIKNNTPNGANLELTTDQDQKLLITLVGYDPEGEEIAFDYTEPQNGKLSSTDQINIIEYTPNEGYFGVDSFTYTVSDTETTSSSYNINLLVYESINLPPVVSSDNTITSVNKEVSIQLYGIDNENSTIRFSISKQASNGVATLSSSGMLVYTPNVDFSGSDTIEVIASDGVMSSDPAVITVTVVEAVNTPPVGIPNAFILYKNSPKKITLEAYDINQDKLTFSIIDFPSNGTLSEIEENKVEYIPVTDFVGDDMFTVIANDGVANSAIYNISLEVLTKENAKPTAIPYTCNRTSGQLFQVMLYGLDSDSTDIGKLTYEVISVTNGSLIEQDNNMLTISPESDAQVLIKYQVNDGKDVSEEATVTIN